MLIIQFVRSLFKSKNKEPEFDREFEYLLFKNRFEKERKQSIKRKNKQYYLDNKERILKRQRKYYQKIKKLKKGKI